MTKELLYPIIFLAVMSTLAGILKQTKGKKKVYRYKKLPALLTNNELRFYRELLPAARIKGLTVFAKVRIADLLEPQQGASQGAFLKISQKHADFVLCDSSTLKPVLVVELDDKTHDRANRIERDQFVDAAMESADMPILHIRSSQNLAEKISQAIAPKATAKK